MTESVSHYHADPPVFKPKTCISDFRYRRVACGRALLIYPISHPDWVSKPDWIVSDWEKVTCKQCLQNRAKVKI